MLEQVLALHDLVAVQGGGSWPSGGFLPVAQAIVLAVVLGGLLGFEREHRGRPAGLRTHILVCLASTLLMLVARNLFNDPGRIAAGIVTGIGFIGAGTIIHLRNTSHGLTTAASIWFVAALGVIIGTGFYLIATVATGTAFVVLSVLHRAEAFLPRYQYYQLIVKCDAAIENTTELELFLQDQGFRVDITSIVSDGPAVGTEIQMDLRTSDSFYKGVLIGSIRDKIGHPCRITLTQ